MKKLFLISCLAIFYATAPVYSAPLIYDGKSVEPACFSALFGKGADTIDLENCADSYIIEKPAPALLMRGKDKGFTGSVYRYKAHKDAPTSTTYYRVLGEKSETLVIEAYSYGGGGSGNFSNLSSMRLQDGALVDIKPIAGGDRCNGSIQDAALEEEKLSWSQTINIYQLLQLRGEHPAINSKDFDSGCVAKADYTDGMLTGIWLNQTGIITRQDIKDSKSWEEKHPIHACFNHLKSKQKRYMSPELLDVFIDTFIKQCISDKEAQ